jgi:uncharacterized repeat protein (TIGR03803 family)
MNLFNALKLRQFAAAIWLGSASLVIMPFALASAATVDFSVLHNFDDTDGGFPMASLIMGSDGNLYGSSLGVDYNDGTIFKITPQGAFTVLHTFGGADGSFPESALVEDADGNFYGTTVFGGGAGSGGAGSVFVITPAGTLTTLHGFSYSDGYEPNGIILGPEGAFYGTTQQGGADNAGVIFRITRGGKFTLLHSFSGSDGAGSQSALTLGKDGNFYGVTYYGGTENYGTIFRMTPKGVLTSLYSFTGEYGSYPTGALVEDADGNFYGTTNFATGAKEGGTVYKFNPTSGEISALYEFFGGAGGEYPLSGVILGPGGTLYGTTLAGGAAGAGVAFALSPSGTLQVLHSFTEGADGGSPAGGLLRVGTSFYGTTSAGGATFYGTIYSLTR